MSLPVVAGVVSTTIFAASTLPMVIKAYRTRDMRSYSLGALMLANLGNLVHSVYVFDLPMGPIWALHGLYLVTTGMMLMWFLRSCPWPGGRDRRTAAEDTGARWT